MQGLALPGASSFPGLAIIHPHSHHLTSGAQGHTSTSTAPGLASSPVRKIPGSAGEPAKAWAATPGEARGKEVGWDTAKGKQVGRAGTIPA